MKIAFNTYFLTLFICIQYFLFSLINSQDAPGAGSNTKLKELEDKFGEVNSVYQNISETMTQVKYNFVLKLRYYYMTRRKEKIEKKISNLKTNSQTLSENDFNEITEYINGYKRSCFKFFTLYQTFENLKNTIYKIIKIFFLTLLIATIIIIIISTLIYLYITSKRKNYEALFEENNRSYFQNNYDTERITIKQKKNKKKKKGIKKEKKKKDNKNDEDVDSEDNKNEKNKNENVEILDDK